MIDPKYLTDRALTWFKERLTHDAELDEQILDDYFTDPFALRTNGLAYDNMSLSVHLANLNLYRNTIIDIQYKVIDQFFHLDTSLSVLSVRVTRAHQEPLFSDMMLRLKFDEDGLIDLWHQLVYPIQRT